MESVVPTSVIQMELPPPSPFQLVTWAPTKEQKFTSWKLPQNTWLRKTATSRILSCSLTPCLLFSLSQNGPTKLHTQQLHNSLCALSNNNRVVHQWVPAHVGIAGNETADRLAKAAAKLTQPHLSTSYKEVKTVLKQKQKSARRLKNNGYDPQKDQINIIDRRTQSTLFRLRTGHCGLKKKKKKNMKRLGLADSACCECGSEEQTPEHILQTCPRPETVRQQIWPEDTEAGTKLWGQAAELQQTADSLADTGQRI